MATLQERRLGYHSQAGLEPRISRFSTLRLNHYAARGTTTLLGYMLQCQHLHETTVNHSKSETVNLTVN